MSIRLISCVVTVLLLSGCSKGTVEIESATTPSPPPPVSHTVAGAKPTTVPTTPSSEPPTVNLGIGTERFRITLHGEGKFTPARNLYVDPSLGGEIFVTDLETGEVLKKKCNRKLLTNARIFLFISRDGKRFARIVVDESKKVVAEIWTLGSEVELVEETVITPGNGLKADYGEFEGLADCRFGSVVFIPGGTKGDMYMIDLDSGRSRNLVPASEELELAYDMFPHSGVFVGAYSRIDSPGRTADAVTRVSTEKHQKDYSIKGYFHAAAASGDTVALALNGENDKLMESHSIVLLDISDFPYRRIGQITTPEPLHPNCLEMSPNGEYVMGWCGDSLYLFKTRDQSIVSKHTWDPSVFKRPTLVPGMTLIFAGYGSPTSWLTNRGVFTMCDGDFGDTVAVGREWNVLPQ